MACAPSEDRSASLITVFAVRMKKVWVLSYPLSAISVNPTGARKRRPTRGAGGGTEPNISCSKNVFKKGSCQLLAKVAKECAQSTGKLLRRLAQEQCG